MMNECRFNSARLARVNVSGPAIILCLLCNLPVAAQTSAAPAERFDQTIAPLLAKRCLACHSGPQPKGELDLTTRQAALKGGSSGPAIVPGKASESWLWQQIDSQAMPPQHPLPAEEKSLIAQWLDAGAKWGSDPIDVFQFSSDVRAGRDWWSLQPLRSVDVPTGSEHPIDAFVERSRRAKGLSGNPPSDKRTYIRRVTFDLLGLPPTPAEVANFVDDESPQAFAVLADRLLQSPHYGERWARHWLDIVRFGESNGFEYDEPRDNFWHYRNWVIEALNADMPYDEFARLQIAGDAWHTNDVKAAAAAGYLVAGPHNTTLPANTKMRMAMAQDEMEDLLGNIGQTFLGLTIHCARCHDHKFDPISQKEYYQLASALAGVTHGQRTLRVPLTPTQVERIDQIDRQRQQIEGQIEQMVAPIRERFRSERASSNAELATKLKEATPPVATATWEFDGNLQDSVGHLNLEAHGGALVQDGALVLDGQQAYAVSPLLVDSVSEKTLEVWVQLHRLDQRGGGAISLETKNGVVFDAIVFGEREPQKWLAGSNNFARTKSFQAEQKEQLAADRVVHIALVYQADGTITAYRNGQPYGQPYNAGALNTFGSGSARLVFGVRHTPAGGNKMLAARIERAQFTNRALTSQEIELSAAYQEVGNIPRSLIVQQLEPPAREQLAQWETQVQQLRAEKSAIEKSQYQTMYTCVSAQPGKTRVLLRGDVGTPAEDVVPAGLRVVGNVSDWQLDEAATDHQRRIKLAEWVTDRSNPLFARVIVNRLWQYHFGQGLVSTPSDLGFNGGEPTHPELLDWLANELIRNGYRLKPLHKLIVTSQTYRQSSQPNAAAQHIDADNKYLWRRSPQRLEAETLRDAILVITDRLDRQVGGPGYRDMRHYFYKGSHFYELLNESGPESRRRTIYRFTPRGNQNPFLSTFDCPDPSATAPRRSITTTPLQALVLLNNSIVFEMADQLARRVEQLVGAGVSEQIEMAFQLAYGRPATADELKRCSQYVREQSLAGLCRVIFNSNEFLYVR